MSPRLAALALCVFSAPASAQIRPSIADPHAAYRVDGRVLRADGAPAVGVVVERVESARGGAPYSRGAYRETTDARGAFRFEFSGLGWGAGSTWHLAFQRPGCRAHVVTLTLRRGRFDSYWEGDLSVGNVIRLPACVTARGARASST